MRRPSRARPPARAGARAACIVGRFPNAYEARASWRRRSSVSRVSSKPCALRRRRSFCASDATVSPKASEALARMGADLARVERVSAAGFCPRIRSTFPATTSARLAVSRRASARRGRRRCVRGRCVGMVGSSIVFEQGAALFVVVEGLGVLGGRAGRRRGFAHVRLRASADVASVTLLPLDGVSYLPALRPLCFGESSATASASSVLAGFALPPFPGCEGEGPGEAGGRPVFGFREARMPDAPVCRFRPDRRTGLAGLKTTGRVVKSLDTMNVERQECGYGKRAENRRLAASGS